MVTEQPKRDPTAFRLSGVSQKHCA